MRLTIGTGYYADKQGRNSAILFHEHWHSCNIKPLDNVQVFVFDNAEKGCSPRWSKYGYQVFKADENIGSWRKIWNYEDPAMCAPNLCGWTVSWMTTAMAAYGRGTDFIYIEQDCLCAGDWLNAILNQAKHQGFKALTGGSVKMGCEQSLFWIDRAFIPWFIGLYLQYPGEGQMLCEDKFKFMIARYPKLFWYHSVGPGRERPIPATGPRSAQHLTEDEIKIFLAQ